MRHFLHLVKSWFLRTPIEARLFCFSVSIHFVASLFLFHRFGNEILFFENEDAYGYMDLAKSVMIGEGFSRAGIPSAFRTPLYPLFLTLPYLLHTSVTWTVLVLQNMVASVAVVTVFAIGRRLFSRTAGLIAAVLYAVEPYMVMTANLATTETLFNCLVLLGVYGLVRFFATPSFRWIMVSAFWFGLATLTRPVALYTPILILILFFCYFGIQQKKRIYIQACLFFAAWVVIFVSVLAPWLIRQHVVFGRWNITNVDANMLYTRVAPLVVSHERNISYADAIGVLNQQLRDYAPDQFFPDAVNTDFRYYDYMVETSKALVRAHPGVVIRFYFLSMIPATTGTGYEYIVEDVFGVHRTTPRVNFTELLQHGQWRALMQALLRLDVQQGVLFAGIIMWLCIYGLIFWSLSCRVVWSKHWFSFILLLSFAGYFFLLTLGPAVHARYRMPTFPFWYLLVGYSITRLSSYIYDKRLRRDSSVQ